MARAHNRQRGGTRGGREQTESDEMAQQAEQMGREGQRMAGETREAVQQGARELASMGERAFEAWMQNTNETLRRVLEVNMEFANWGRDQLDDNISAVRSLAQCRTVGDAYGVQIGLMRTSMEKSMRHASNVFNLATRAMVGGMQRAQQAGSSAAEHMRSSQAD